MTNHISTCVSRYNTFVHPDIAQSLIDLNRQFYQTFALQFSATRQRLQPGVRQILKTLSSYASILDLGCGNGGLWRELSRLGYSGSYVGLDFSPGLLAEAHLRDQSKVSNHPIPHFLQADLSSPGWDAVIPNPPFDVILAFAVLHHLPGEDNRRQLLKKAHALLTRGGRFIHSEWQFLNSPRLRARIQPWEKAGLYPDQVDPGDYLLDWRQGGEGLRYVHHFTEIELAMLSEESGFQIMETFYSDGEGGRLGLYQIWERI